MTWAALHYGPGFGLVNSTVLTSIIAAEMKRKDDVCVNLIPAASRCSEQVLFVCVS